MNFKELCKKYLYGQIIIVKLDNAWMKIIINRKGNLIVRKRNTYPEIHCENLYEFDEIPQLGAYFNSHKVYYKRVFLFGMKPNKLKAKMRKVIPRFVNNNTLTPFIKTRRGS